MKRFGRTGGAVFTAVLFPINQVVAVIDDGDGRRKSVTNDAENVVDLLRQVGMLRNCRLIYRDTMGMWDEIVLRDDGRFAGFAPLQTRCVVDAVARCCPS